MEQTTPHTDAIAAGTRLIALIERSLTIERTTVTSDDSAIRLPVVRYALAQLRQRIQPALLPGWLTTDPVHVVMFGGTNSGKSTVLNVLLGRAAAGMSYRARFSQHPQAFRPDCMGSGFLDNYPTRFAGYERFVDQDPPRRTDKELRQAGYRYALAVIDPQHRDSQAIVSPAAQAVFWDIPDFSTEEALVYMPAVLDAIGLADLLVMTVTKENYADHRGNLLRAMVCASGVPMRVVANKLEDDTRLLDDIRMKLADSDDGTCRIADDHLHPLPHVREADEQARLARLVFDPGATELRSAVAEDVATGPALKTRALAGAVRYLARHLDDLLAPLQAEIAVGQRWHAVVDRTTRREFYDRYRRDYLDGEKYVDFNQTLVKLLDMLEVPGIGPIISAISKGLKAISSAIVGTFVNTIRSLFSGKTEPTLRSPERDVVAAAFEQWLQALRNEAQILAERREHPAWAAIVQQLSNYQFVTDLAQRIGSAYVDYRERMDAITSERARALYETIRGKPALLHTLRTVKLGLDAGTTSLVIASHGLNWTDAVIGPLVIPVQRLLLEYGLERYMDVQKARLKQEQIDALTEMIDTHMVAPVRQLFVGAVSPQEMEQARSDFQTIRNAVAEVTGS